MYWSRLPHYTIISADNGSCWHDRAGVGGGRNPLTKWIKRKSREVCPCRQCAPLYIRIHTLILLFLLCVPTKEGHPRLTVTNGGLVLQQITRRARTSQRWNTARSPPLSSFLSHRKGWAALFSFQLRLVPHNGCCHMQRHDVYVRKEFVCACERKHTLGQNTLFTSWENNQWSTWKTAVYWNWFWLV